MWEVEVRQWLQLAGCTVSPNESLSGLCGGPDFRCERHGKRFYVEATCIEVGTAEKRTGIPFRRMGASGVDIYGMTDAILKECQGKAPQCADLDAPCLLAIGTFHLIAATVGFKKVLLAQVLTGHVSMSWEIDLATGETIDGVHNESSLRAAAFIKPDSGAVSFARLSISGLLFPQVGRSPRSGRGLLNPGAVRPFRPEWLPEVEFGKLEVDSAGGRLVVSWPPVASPES